jgi:hypothetical protein
MSFANRLEAMLRDSGFEPLIDRHDIYAFEDWWRRIESLISEADTVIFVLSPEALASEVALKEVAHAASLNKRFAPIVCKPGSIESIPEVLRRLNFIYFDDPARFESSARELVNALRTSRNLDENRRSEGGMPQRLRIFISSPGDVPDERLRADLIVEKLSQEYGRFFTIESCWHPGTFRTRSSHRAPSTSSC